MKIFYHVDSDGKCAGYWVGELAHPDKYETEYFKIDYGVSFPFEIINKDEYIYIVDYSILPEEMDRLLKITENVTWIDHHISAIKKYDGYNKDIRGIRHDGIAGCMLTYCYLTFMTNGGVGEILPFEKEYCDYAPKFTKLIADYDVWEFKYGDDSKLFKNGFEIFSNEPYDDIWNELNNGFTGDKKLQEIINTGRDIKTYRENFMRDYCKTKGFECEFEEYNCFAINIAMVGSDDFVGVETNKYDILIGFSYNGETWNYSLRSKKVDCSKVAMKYGGGGHKGAAGFNSEVLLLKKKKTL